MHTGLQGDHLYGLSRALTCAESTRLLVLDGDAEVASPDGVSDLYGSALFYGDGLYGRGRADLRTAVTLRATIAALVAYLGLHEAVEAAAWAQDVVGASVDAELASSAMTAQVAYGE